MQRYARWIGALLFAVAAGTAGGAGTSIDDKPILSGWPFTLAPGQWIYLTVQPKPPFRAEDVQIYVRGPTAEGGVEVRGPLPDHVNIHPDIYYAVIGPFTVEGRYVVEYYAATFTPGVLPVATHQFSVATNGLLTAIEYFNASLGHYFVTAFPLEIAQLDAGMPAGWVRTGEHFTVLAADSMPSNAAAVCRYYGLPAAGLDTHFLSDIPAECAAIPRLWPDQWVLETTGAFAVPQGYPFNVFSQCGEYVDENDPYDVFRALYRLYNNRPDANHRYTTSRQIRDQMMKAGWILEGRYPADGSNVYAMCVMK